MSWLDKLGVLPFDGGRIKVYGNQIKSFEPNILSEIEGPYGCSEQMVVKAMLPHFTHDATFIDIGANIGVFSIIAAKRCKAVYAFEANPDIFEVLSENLLDFENKTLFNVAIYDKAGEKTFYLHEKRGGADTLIETRIGDNVSSHIIVTTKTLDSFGLRADIIKIDVEGAEQMVIAGGLDTLRAAKIIFVEHHGVRIDDFVKRYGFCDMAWCDDDHLMIKPKPPLAGIQSRKVV